MPDDPVTSPLAWLAAGMPPDGLSVTDALDNEVQIDVDPDARTETVVDAVYGFTAKGCRLADGTPFAVVPIPVPGVPTTWSCR